MNWVKYLSTYFTPRQKVGKMKSYEFIEKTVGAKPSVKMTPHTPTTTPDAMPVVDYLRGLGSDPDEVADTLRTMNVTGVVSHGLDCPISNALSTAGYGEYSVGMEDCREIVGWENDSVDVDWAGGSTKYPITVPVYGDAIPNPGPVKEFIMRFDQGIYQDLEADEVTVKYGDI